jgi:hypothetical protein
MSQRSHCSSVLGLETTEAVDLDVLDKAVELLLGVLILVLLSADSHADLSGNVSDTSAPHKSVQAGVNADVLNINHIR